MIVTTATDGSRIMGAAGHERRQRCVARRGMLHSECESVSHVALPAFAEFEIVRNGSESALFVLGGRGTTDAGASQPVGEGDLVLAPMSSTVRFEAGDEGLELLWIRVLPEALSRVLPPRRPVVR